MKRFTLALALSTFAAQTWAQQPSQDELKKRKSDKLAADFLKKAGWVADFAAAKEEAKKSGKLVFAYFTRSYSA